MKKTVVSILVFTFLQISCVSKKEIKTLEKPNIIFIMADDLGWQDVGFMGSKWFETPNLDALAKKSKVFTNAYMYPTCSPSRTALLTGKQSFRTGVYNVPVLEKKDADKNIYSRWTVDENIPLYSNPLNKAGYKLIHIGKWHIVGPYPETEKNYPFKAKLSQPDSGDLSWLENHTNGSAKKYYPTERGFHKNVGGTWWGDPARGYNKGYASESGGYKAPFKNPFIEDKPTDNWLTDRLTDEAMAFMEANSNAPFFVNLNYYAPHRPTVAKNNKWFDYFMAKAGDSITGQGISRRERIAAYATMIKSIDENVGRIIDFLKQKGLSDNTVIVFTSDNGFNGIQSTNYRLRGAKGTVYEGGIRVPAFVHWPKKIKAGVSETPISGLDYFPTFLDLANIKDFNGVLDGSSLVPEILGKATTHPPLFWHIASTCKNPPSSIIRKGDWKLIQNLISGELQLYNLKTDLKEQNNLAEENVSKTQELLKELKDWREDNKAPLPKASVLK